MTAAYIDGADAIGANVAHLPRGLGVVALYVTGDGDVPATPAELAANPGAIRIAQWPALNVDEAAHADELDVEDGAATLEDCAPWAKNADAAYQTAARPGQRPPTIYASQGKMGDITAALAAGGVGPDLCGLHVASWTGSKTAALAVLGTKINGYLVTGVQWANAGAYDLDVFLSSWVNAVSRKVAPVEPPGQWLNPAQWTWSEVTVTGIGLDGDLHSFAYNGRGNTWAKVI